MAISADFNRVFEVGPVFRAENSNTRRHLCEFTGLDFEMEINEHYMEALTVAHTMFKHIFENLETRFANELKVVRQVSERSERALTCRWRVVGQIPE
jgi:aspartyl-tRNA synthetase